MFWEYLYYLFTLKAQVNVNVNVNVIYNARIVNSVESEAQRVDLLECQVNK